MELTPIQRQRAVDAVYGALREGILSHMFKPGERLNIEELSLKLGVSLTPVRNAIQQLATEGLIEIRPRSGTFVANLTARDVEETFDLRCALECLAAEKAAQRITPADLEKMRALHQSMSREIKNDAGRKQHERDNSEFHLILVKAAGNRRLEEMYQSLNAHLKIARIHGSGEDWRARLGQEHAEHEVILEALAARDSAKLVTTLRDHINRAKDALVATLNA